MKTERLSGVGTLYEGERLVGKVRYRIHAESPKNAADPPGRSRGLLDLVGSQMGFSQRELDAMVLTLHLEDGRRWDCVMITNGGDVKGDSLIYQP